MQVVTCPGSNVMLKHKKDIAFYHCPMTNSGDGLCALFCPYCLAVQFAHPLKVRKSTYSKEITVMYMLPQHSMYGASAFFLAVKQVGSQQFASAELWEDAVTKIRKN